MNWFLALALFLVILFLIFNYKKRRKRKKLQKQFAERWGQAPVDQYFNFNQISKYFDNNHYKDNAFQIIPDKTAIDLDIDEVFKTIDHTSSKIGQQYLYYKLRTIPDRPALKAFDKLVELFESHEKLRIDCQVILSALNQRPVYALANLITNEQIKKPKVIWVAKVLSLLVIVFFFLGFIHSVFFLFLLPIFITNMLFHYKNKANIKYYMEGIIQLSKALRAAQELSKHREIKKFFTDLSFVQKVEKIKFKMKYIRTSSNPPGDEFALLLWFITELFNIFLNIEYILFFSFIDSIKKQQKPIERMYRFIGEIDAAISIASVKYQNNEICSPSFTESKSIDFKEIIHPLVENCVSNSLSLKDKSILLTGSNMSGKTTFIRTIAINSILAQTFNFCFAKSYTAPFLKIYSSIRIADDVLKNTSYYLEEVLTIKEFITASKTTTPCLFVLDEIFKGTNTIERIAAGEAILSYLSNGNNIVLVSTHDVELTELLGNNDYELFCFTEYIDKNDLFFDYKLKRGILKSGNAIDILSLQDFPDEIIASAKKTKGKFISTKSINKS